jgi:hypothetical protein
MRYGLLALALAGCSEPTSTYDPQRGRYVSTEEYHQSQIQREIDRNELKERK